MSFLNLSCLFILTSNAIKKKTETKRYYVTVNYRITSAASANMPESKTSIANSSARSSMNMQSQLDYLIEGITRSEKLNKSLNIKSLSPYVNVQTPLDAYLVRFVKDGAPYSQLEGYKNREILQSLLACSSLGPNWCSCKDTPTGLCVACCTSLEGLISVLSSWKLQGISHQAARGETSSTVRVVPIFQDDIPRVLFWFKVLLAGYHDSNFSSLMINHASPVSRTFHKTRSGSSPRFCYLTWVAMDHHLDNTIKVLKNMHGNWKTISTLASFAKSDIASLFIDLWILLDCSMITPGGFSEDSLYKMCLTMVKIFSDIV